MDLFIRNATLVMQAENLACFSDFKSSILRLGYIYLSVGRIIGYDHVSFPCYPCFNFSGAEIALLI